MTELEDIALLKLQKDAEIVYDNSFWREHVKRIYDYRDSITNHLETCSLDNIKEEQGKLRAIKKILGIPGDILGKTGDLSMVTFKKEK